MYRDRALRWRRFHVHRLPARVGAVLTVWITFSKVIQTVHAGSLYWDWYWHWYWHWYWYFLPARVFLKIIQ